MRRLGSYVKVMSSKSRKRFAWLWERAGDASTASDIITWIIGIPGAIGAVAGVIGPLAVSTTDVLGTVIVALLTGASALLGLWVVGSMIHARELSASGQKDALPPTQPKPPIAIERDAYLSDAVFWILHGSWDVSDQPDLGRNKVPEILTAILQDAFDGKMRVWGKKVPGHFLDEFGLWEEIPAQFWATNYVDVLSLFRAWTTTGDNTHTDRNSNTIGMNIVGKYGALKVSRVQIENLWPPERPRT